MKVDRLVSACAAVALFLGLAGSANANIVTVTYQGVVADGVDKTDLFGLGVNADLTGKSYTAVFTINDTVHAYTNHEPGLLDQIFGGLEYPSPNGDQSPVSAVLTINNHAASIPGLYQGAVWQETLNSPNPHAEIYERARDTGDDGVNTYVDDMYNQILSWVQPMMTTEDYHVPLSYTVQPHNVVHGFFTDQVYSDATGIYSINVTADLNPSSVTIADVRGVPEPATWAMLILGVAMVGFAARRRSQVAALAA